VFEAGPSREAVTVEISPDGAAWTSVGEAPGGFYALDIGPFVKAGDTFRFIRLTDVADSGGDNEVWPGAEIDAVAALRPAPAVAPAPPPERISIPSEVLFGFDSDVLGAGAPAELDRVSELLAGRPSARLAIEGHTDDVGDDAYNLALSERRAAAVKAYLVHKGVAADRIEARGFGETRPVVPNTDDASRRRNRRVELIVSSAH
jgi:outer membrane protein OmpA-like peptidoglycan-associated protein